jgi:hypothetical protein
MAVRKNRWANCANRGIVPTVLGGCSPLKRPATFELHHPAAASVPSCPESSRFEPKRVGPTRQLLIAPARANTSVHVDSVRIGRAMNEREADANTEGKRRLLGVRTRPDNGGFAHIGRRWGGMHWSAPCNGRFFSGASADFVCGAVALAAGEP